MPQTCPQGIQLDWMAGHRDFHASNGSNTLVSRGLQFYELVEDANENKKAHGITRRMEVSRTKNYNHHSKRKQTRQGLNPAVRG